MIVYVHTIGPEKKNNMIRLNTRMSAEREREKEQENNNNHQHQHQHQKSQWSRDQNANTENKILFILFIL